MEKLTKKQKIQEDKSIQDEYRFLLPFETEREYELVYADKEKNKSGGLDKKLNCSILKQVATDDKTRRFL